MWLINTTSLRLELFTPPEVPAYAILSHTWGKEEVTFHEFQRSKDMLTKDGFVKIHTVCLLARAQEIDYCWVDTCCIDKSSSAELSESINSMYNWYRQSKVCYAYIDDWSPEFDWIDLESLSSEKRCERGLDGPQTKPLRWFTRGWTLQELIAPSKMEFYDQDWNFKGSKSEGRIVEHLSRITGIDSLVLEDGSEGNLRGIALGQRMSWASRRKTTRTEDIAYCLLGIFQVNMPLIYGEGERAFLRLQEEIIKFSTDMSLFAWSCDAEDPEYLAKRGIMSPHPRDFSRLGNLSMIPSPFFPPREFTMTNKGLRVEAPLFYLSQDDRLVAHFGIFVMPLGYTTGGDHYYICLQNINDVYVRAFPERLLRFNSVGSTKTRTIYLARDFDGHANLVYSAAVRRGLKINLAHGKSYTLSCVEAWPLSGFDGMNMTILAHELGWLFFSLRIAIVSQNSHSQGKLGGNIGECIVIWISTGANDIAVHLLEGTRAVDFAKRIEEFQDIDPLNAQRQGFHYFSSMSWPDVRAVRMRDEALDTELEIVAHPVSPVPQSMIKPSWAATISLEELN